MRRRSVTALLAGAAVLFAACGDDASTDTSAPTAVVAEVAAGPAAAPATTGDCNALESYEPTFELPEPGGDMPAGSRMAEIQERGRLRVGVSADTLLFGFRNPITGQIEGFDVDVLRAVADAILGPRQAGEPDNIEFKVITYAQRLPSLTDGDVDLVAHTMTINCERWETIAFSTEYFTAGQNLLVRKSLDGTGPKTPEDLVGPDHKVCVAAGSTNLQTMQSRYPEVQLEIVDDLTDCLVLFQQSAVDAITGDNTVMAGFAAQDPYGDADTKLFTTEPYGVGASLEHPELVEFVNLVLEEMRQDGRLAELGEKWLGAEQTVPQGVYGRQPG
jgi:polar amino acid transport system substrate-binding protein